MILKTNQLKKMALIVLLLQMGRASALDVFNCVRDLMPITEQAAFQVRRVDVEKPFMSSEKFMIFPEVKKGVVSGFFIYTPGKAWYYDRAQAKPTKSEGGPIVELVHTNESPVFTFIVQPSGLETVSIQYLPGYGSDGSTREGPVMLGSSMFPVIGALVSRTNEQLHRVYRNPEEVEESDLKQWIYDHQSRKLATVSAVEIKRKMLYLATEQSKAKVDLWEPLNNELKVRKLWVQSHNLDEVAFRKLSYILESSCR